MALEEFALPEGEEADYLLAGLARLLELRGVGTFLAAPIVLQEARYFPDPVETRAKAVSVLLRRLLAYAGLVPKGLAVEIFAADRAPNVVAKAHQGAHVQAWFMDVAEGVYRFGVRDTALNDERGLVGTLSHEVAHAYRAHHRLQVRDPDVEEQLTDLTTVYLGFGALSLEASYRYQTGHYNAEGKQLLYEVNSGGYLRPGQLAFLLAAQLVARGGHKKFMKSLGSTLSANQFAALSSGCERFAAEALELSEALRLPPAAERPSARRLEEALTPLPPTELRLYDAPSARREQLKRERVSFRVAGHRGPLGVLAGAVSGFLLGLWLGFDAGFWPFTFGLAAAGWRLGKWLPAPKCSSCDRRVRASFERCPSCSTLLVGDIEHINERLDAEERHAAQTRAVQVALLAGVRCPLCAWVPRTESHWACSCGESWNTFLTRGHCPRCSKQWQQTACLSCKGRSAHATWYPAEPGAAAMSEG